MKATTLLLAAVSVSAIAGCRGQTSRETPIFGIRNMFDQPKYEMQEESEFFPDHRTMRPLVEGVVAHDEETDPGIGRGRLEDESGYVLEIPQQVIARHGGMEAMLKRGEARFNIYCAPCHDMTGSGEGMVKKRAVAGGAAAFVPPTFHQDRIRHMPDGQLFATISNGKSNMPPYAMQIAVDDRWAIVGWVRALQVAQPKMAAQAPAAPTSQGPLGPAPGGTAAAAAATAAPTAGATVPPSDQQGPGQPSTKPTGSPSAHVAPTPTAPGASSTPTPSTPPTEKKP